MNTVMVSNYKRICPACNKMIKRGDLVTRCWNADGMVLRGVTFPDGSFYTRYTGNYILHKDCSIPGFWTDYTAEKFACEQQADYKKHKEEMEREELCDRYDEEEYRMYKRRCLFDY